MTQEEKRALLKEYIDMIYARECAYRALRDAMRPFDEGHGLFAPESYGWKTQKKIIDALFGEKTQEWIDWFFEWEFHPVLDQTPTVTVDGQKHGIESIGDLIDICIYPIKNKGMK